MTEEKLSVIKTLILIPLVIWMIPISIMCVIGVCIEIGANTVANLAQDYVQDEYGGEIVYIGTQYHLVHDAYIVKFEVYINDEETPAFTFALSYKPRGWWQYELVKETYTKELLNYSFAFKWTIAGKKAE